MSILDFNLKHWLTGMLVFGCQQFLVEVRMKSCNVEDADVHGILNDKNGEHGCNEDFDDACDVGAVDIVFDEDASDYGNVIGLNDQQIMRKVFRSEKRAYEFYCKFGRCHGFGVRKGIMTNCMAKLSIYLDRENSVRKVRKVILEHNHELTPRVMVHMIPKFRQMSNAAKAHIDGMHGYGIPMSKILGYMAGIAGGYSLLGFMKKDAYNYIDKMSHSKIADGDSNAANVYLEGKAAADPMAMARYNLTDDGMLANMFWVDGISRVDYQYFGDVVAFDSTYKKNKYNRPLVIFSGSNNNKQTTIFGFGLVLNETITSYTWMLENLLEVMCNKPPSVVVTDGDEAMIAAVKKVFPEATHRLCAWNL
ncbi:protein FAR1-RELATED SEQUENCE 5-like [Arachis ipaensis]|uniref:protein FAR1-RELATED SEQUENCE 5-like n=1 Tax=Arachis ipaensis TaxID=130454 RepID=UPI0007AF9A62|nr:protein FAR1-RELATED SEQUENCE 5-like [Arachis ipaensis]XP_025664841.1 protein FAR1-RELATED SEQUENCE 5-like [Arachis hypogaea]